MKILTKISALLHSFMNAPKAPRESSSNEDQVQNSHIRPDEIIKRENIKGTPFTIVQIKNQTFVALGMYKLTQDLTYKECLEAIKNKDWALILNIARLIAIDEINITKATLEEQDPTTKKGNKHLTKTN